MIFGISGILSLEQGFFSLTDNDYHFENSAINYIAFAFAFAFAFEANALRIALIQFKKSITKRDEKTRLSTLLGEFKNSKDTSILTVVVEDTTALL